MRKIAVGITVSLGLLAPLAAHADVSTVQIGDKTVTYVVTAPQKGPGLTREEILDRIRQSKPMNLTEAPPAQESEQPAPKPEQPK